jgi:hypothetical protein
MVGYSRHDNTAVLSALSILGSDQGREELVYAGHAFLYCAPVCSWHACREDRTWVWFYCYQEPK